jgi:thymidylate synthase
MLRFDLASGAMPLLTTKRVYWKTATRELLWFLTGSTNIRPLVLQGVKIWNEWPHAQYVRETGDAVSLDDFVARIAADEGFAARCGDLGPVYGKQCVDWPTYRYRADGLYEKGESINQVAAVIESLRTSPGSRRHIIEGWNVAELDRMALPPCHKTYQFHVAGEGADARLNCLLYQRSCDVALGLPIRQVLLHVTLDGLDQAVQLLDRRAQARWGVLTRQWVHASWVRLYMTASNNRP